MAKQKMVFRDKQIMLMKGGLGRTCGRKGALHASGQAAAGSNDLLIYSDCHISQGSDSGTDSERMKENPCAVHTVFRLHKAAVCHTRLRLEANYSMFIRTRRERSGTNEEEKNILSKVVHRIGGL